MKVFIVTLVLVMALVSGKNVLEPPPYCLLPVQPGNCQAKIQNYFYNVQTGHCEAFYFTGCGGNMNRFHSLEQCLRRCSCHFPKDTGPCKAAMPRWAYNHHTGCCEQFTFGGCKGNGNNFKSKEVCASICESTVPGIMKPLGIEWGSGYDRKTQGDLAYGNYGASYGGSGTIWIHNDQGIGSGGGNANFMTVISRTGKQQVPGVQTKTNVQVLFSQDKAPETTGTQQIVSNQLSGFTGGGSANMVTGTGGGQLITGVTNMGGGTGGGSQLTGGSMSVGGGTGGSGTFGTGTGGRSWTSTGGAQSWTNQQTGTSGLMGLPGLTGMTGAHWSIA